MIKLTNKLIIEEYFLVYKNPAKQTIEEAFNNNFSKLYKFFLQKSLNKQTAEDLTSETFTRFAEQINANSSIEDTKTYLYGIARNVFNEYLRVKYQTSDLDLDTNQIAETIDDYSNRTINDLEDALANCLEKLSRSQSNVLRLRFIERLSPKDIARKLNKNINYFKTTQRRAIASMRALVESGKCLPKLTKKV
ncbi:MAG: RNA polymerase sigma factor [Candidatus Dojkabacteria bacterium]|nr:MAG: RNA polymerase sigma factor [Candidatus Dojkabacteria bacterium]